MYITSVYNCILNMSIYVLPSCHSLQSFWHLEVLESLVYGKEERNYFSK